MSGPWDRPSSPNPDDRDWPAEDFPASSSSQPPADPWSSNDPWAESPRPSTAWDVWPSPAPADDYVAEEPRPTISDPWAESWSDEADNAYAPSGGDYASSERDHARAEPDYAPAEPDYAAAEPDYARAEAVEVSPDSVPSEPADATYDGSDNGAWSAAEAAAFTPSSNGPRVEPWAPDSDPWATTEEWTPAEPWRDEAAAPPSPPDRAEREASPPEWPIEPAPHAPPAFDALPREPAAEPWPEPTFLEQPDEVVAVEEAADGSAEAATAEAAPGPAPETQPQTEPEPEPERRAPTARWPLRALHRDRHPPVEAEVDASSAEPATDIAEDEEPPTAAEAERAPEPEPEPEPISLVRRAYQSIFPSEEDEEPEPPPSVEAMAEAPVTQATTPPPERPDRVVPVEPSLEAFDATFDVAEAVAEPEPEPEPEPQPEREAGSQVEPEPQPEPPIEPVWEADLWASAAASQPPIERTSTAAEPRYDEPAQVASAGSSDWQPEPWQHRAESTEVLPSSWTPPPPLPRDDRAGLEPQTGRIRTSLARGTRADAAQVMEPRPSTAEQAVPWLIGVILLLAGMVIVLLALIFAGDGSLGGAASSQAAGLGGVVPLGSSEEASPTSSQAATPAPSASAPLPSSSPPLPQYGALEMIYQGRSAALAPIYLLHHDFTIEEDPEILAQDPNLDVRGFTWSPDGTVGAGLYADLLISIEPGKEKRNLGDGIVSVTFGDDASTLYAVRLTEDAGNEVATVLSVSYASGEQTEIATITYPRPDVADEAPVREAQFADEGGLVRLYWMDDNTLRLWSLGAGSWTVDPASGTVTDMRGEQPVLWSPGALRRITLTLADGVTGIRLHEGDDETPVAETSVEGYVSHVRWSPKGDIVSFTVGREGTGGGVFQDLYAWYLGDGEEPMRLTNTGAAFGAEWRGTAPRWASE